MPTNDIVFNAADERIYASVPALAGARGNSITLINPRTGEIGSSVFVGSEPSNLALAGDGQTLYAFLAGSFSIGRYNMSTQTAQGKFPIGGDLFYGPLTLSDLSVAPNNPDLVAVARQKPNTGPSTGGVAAYANGVRLQETAPDHIAGSDFITFGDSNSIVYGSGFYSGLKTMSVGPNGVTVTASASSLVGGARMKHQGGKIFASNGQVIEAANTTLLGTFPQVSSPAFVPDTAVGRVYFLVKQTSPANTWVLKAYDLNTFTQIGSLTISNVLGDTSSLVRWGTNGLAFRTTLNQIVLIQTSLIPTDNPIPEPSPTPSVTPTPTPTPFAISVRQVNLPTGDLVSSPQRSKLYASVPGAGGIGVGNRVVEIDPGTGTIGASVFVGSEPGKMAISEDEELLHVGLSGSGSYRHVNLTSMVAGPQYALANNSSGQTSVIFDMDVAPGAPQTVVMSIQNGPTAIYDAGVRRPQIYNNSSGYVRYASPSDLYTNSGSSGSLLHLSMVPQGLNQVLTFPASANGAIETAGGLIYTLNGRVVEGASRTIQGVFPGVSSDSVMTVDAANNRAYFMNAGSPFTLKAFELDTFRPIGSVAIPSASGFIRGLVRWGTNGIAFRTDSSIYFIQTSLVNPAEPVPTPTPTVTPTPTPTPSPVFFRRLNVLANDLAYNSQTNSVLISVPGISGAGSGNTVTHIDPTTGQITGSTFVGSEPTKMAVSDDGQTMYVTLNGANAVRRYNMVTRTAGQQFTLPTAFAGPNDIKVMPGYPGTIALAGHTNGVSVFDDGVQRPTTATGGAYAINSIDFTEISNVFYGYDNYSSGFELVKFTASNAGVTGSLVANNLISGYSNQIKYLNGLIYATGGRVVNPDSRVLLGTFQGGGNTMAIDQASNRIFFMNSNVLSAYDLTTFVKIGSVSVPSFSGAPTSLVRWGANGLAFRINSFEAVDNGRVYLLQTSLVSDQVPVPTGLQLNSASYSASESGSLAVNVSVNRTGNLSVASSVDYATANGTAIAGSDYVSTSGTINFGPGETIKNFVIPIVNDTTFEGSETFSVTLSNAVGADINLLTPTTGTVTIGDNDARPRISASGTSGSEPRLGNTTVINVPVVLTNPSVETVTVNYATSNGTALAGADYLPVSGTLTFEPLQTSKSIAIQVMADRVDEPDETFTFTLSSPNNSSLQSGTATLTIRNLDVTATLYDYDGDGKSDLSIHRSADNVWYLLQGTTGYTAITWGEAGDRMAPADYDGDGKTDVAVFRPSTGQWYVVNSSNLTFVTYNWGQDDDLPVPTDRDNDGRADLVLFRPSNNTWYPRSTATGPLTPTQFGEAGDKPMVGDFDADGIGDIALFRPSNNNWYIIKSSLGFFVQTWGEAGDIPTTGDFDGDGATDQAVFRPSTGQWFLSRTTAGFSSQFWGQNGDIPVAADYDGDGKTDVAVFRPSNATWYIVNSTAGIQITQFGQTGDVPTQSSYLY